MERVDGWVRKDSRKSVVSGSTGCGGIRWLDWNSATFPGLLYLHGWYTDSFLTLVLCFLFGHIHRGGYSPFSGIRSLLVVFVATFITIVRFGDFLNGKALDSVSLLLGAFFGIDRC